MQMYFDTELMNAGSDISAPKQFEPVHLACLKKFCLSALTEILHFDLAKASD